MHSGIYVHIPFCHSKCGYCDFYSITELNHISAFVGALAREIEIYAKEYEKNIIFDTIYFGGGTPSVLGIDQICFILNVLAKHFKIHPQAEITIEINPGTVDETYLKNLKQAGFNRLSIGIQSFNDEELKFLDRIHNKAEAINALQSARKSGFENISIDLIYALPDQSLNQWKHNLQTVIKFQPEHISAYNLSIEGGTPFWDLKDQGLIKPKSETAEQSFFKTTDEILTKVGYNHYEISNFSFGAEYISKHNYKYWQHQPYIGFGPSAHSFYHNKRQANCRSVESYLSDLKINKKPIEFCETLSTKDLEFEYIFLSLRTYNGLNLEEFRKRFKSEFQVKYQSKLKKMLDVHCAELDDTYFKLSKKGMMLCDEILPAFIID